MVQASNRLLMVLVSWPTKHLFFNCKHLCTGTLKRFTCEQYCYCSKTLWRNFMTKWFRLSKNAVQKILHTYINMKPLLHRIGWIDSYQFSCFQSLICFLDLKLFIKISFWVNMSWAKGHAASASCFISCPEWKIGAAVMHTVLAHSFLVVCQVKSSVL